MRRPVGEVTTGSPEKEGEAAKVESIKGATVLKIDYTKERGRDGDESEIVKDASAHSYSKSNLTLALDPPDLRLA